MRIWSLSGGGTKIFWEGAVLATLLRGGLSPDRLVGVSAGALLAAFVSARFRSTADLPSVADAIEDLLLGRVAAGRHVFARKRRLPSLAWRFVTKRWEGLYDTAPLADLLRESIPLADLRDSPCPAAVGLTQANGVFRLIRLASAPDPLAAVRASAAIPGTMPGVEVPGLGLCFDGGLRDIAPLAIRGFGATEILAVVTHPEGERPPLQNPRDLLGLVSWAVGNLTAEVLEGDLQGAELVNALVAAGLDTEHRHVPIDVVRPGRPVEIGWEYSRSEAEAAWMHGEADALAWLRDRETVVG